MTAYQGIPQSVSRSSPLKDSQEKLSICRSRGLRQLLVGNKTLPKTRRSTRSRELWIRKLEIYNKLAHTSHTYIPRERSSSARKGYNDVDPLLYIYIYIYSISSLVRARRRERWTREGENAHVCKLSRDTWRLADNFLIPKFSQRDWLFCVIQLIPSDAILQLLSVIKKLL